MEFHAVLLEFESKTIFDKIFHHRRILQEILHGEGGGGGDYIPEQIIDVTVLGSGVGVILNNSVLTTMKLFKEYSDNTIDITIDTKSNRDMTLDDNKSTMKLIPLDIGDIGITIMPRNREAVFVDRHVQQCDDVSTLSFSINNNRCDAYCYYANLDINIPDGSAITRMYYSHDSNNFVEFAPDDISPVDGHYRISVLTMLKEVLVDTVLGFDSNGVFNDLYHSDTIRFAVEVDNSPILCDLGYVNVNTRDTVDTDLDHYDSLCVVFNNIHGVFTGSNVDYRGGVIYFQYDSDNTITFNLTADNIYILEALRYVVLVHVLADGVEQRGSDSTSFNGVGFSISGGVFNALASSSNSKQSCSVNIELISPRGGTVCKTLSYPLCLQECTSIAGKSEIINGNPLVVISNGTVDISATTLAFYTATQELVPMDINTGIVFRDEDTNKYCLFIVDLHMYHGITSKTMLEEVLSDVRTIAVDGVTDVIEHTMTVFSVFSIAVNNPQIVRAFGNSGKLDPTVVSTRIINTDVTGSSGIEYENNPTLSQFINAPVIRLYEGFRGVVEANDEDGYGIANKHGDVNLLSYAPIISNYDNQIGSLVIDVVDLNSDYKKVYVRTANKYIPYGLLTSDTFRDPRVEYSLSLQWYLDNKDTMDSSDINTFVVGRRGYSTTSARTLSQYSLFNSCLTKYQGMSITIAGNYPFSQGTVDGIQSMQQYDQNYEGGYLRRLHIVHTWISYSSEYVMYSSDNYGTIPKDKSYAIALGRPLVHEQFLFNI